MNKTFSKIIALVLALCCVFGSGVIASAYTPDGIGALREKFIAGEGPVEDGFSIDYRYYSPVTKNYDGVGLTPDIVVKTPENLTDFAHSTYESDPQMQAAREALWK